MGINIIITGATGFVGEGVLLTCLQHADVNEVLMVNRRPYNLTHPKLKELLVPNFFKLDAFAAQLKGYDACLYCAGISSAGIKEKDYSYITYDTTLAFANTLLQLNPNMVFDFVSGSHTDSSEQGRIMWARVKGKTENALSKLPFKKVYHFRPGGMKAIAGQKNAKPLYKFIVGAIGLLLPKQVCTLKEVGLAMINAVLKGYNKQVLEIADIKALAKN